MQVEPTPEAIEAALLCAERKYAGDFDIASEILGYAYRALLEKQPRIWTAETIGEAPEGEYRIYRPSANEWAFNAVTKKSAIQILSTSLYPKAYGPIPTPEGV